MPSDHGAAVVGTERRLNGGPFIVVIVRGQRLMHSSADRSLTCQPVRVDLLLGELDIR